MSNQLGFSFDARRCSGCMACVAACQDQNDLVSCGIAYRQVNSLEEGSNQQNIKISYLSISCMHCKDAPCLAGCPSKAIFRRERGNIVDVNRDICIGCRNCEAVCPVDAPKFTRDGKMAKCDFCSARMIYGLKPACVNVCPTRALEFVSLEIT